MYKVGEEYNLFIIINFYTLALLTFLRTPHKKDSVKYLQLSISIWHNCRSIGKYCRFMGHDAVIVNLEKNHR